MQGHITMLLGLILSNITNAQITIQELSINYGGIFYPADKLYDLNTSCFSGKCYVNSNYTINGKRFYTTSETWSKAGYIEFFAYPTSLSLDVTISIKDADLNAGITYVGYPIRRVAITRAGPVLYNIWHVYSGIKTKVYKTNKTAFYTTYLLIGRIGKIKDGTDWLKRRNINIHDINSPSIYYPYVLQDAFGLATQHNFYLFIGKKHNKALTISLKIMYFFIGGGRNIYPFQFEPSIGLTWILVKDETRD